jgi:putative intracellular protease/amidase
MFDRFELLDLFGPMEMLGLLPEEFSLETVAERPGPVVSNQKLRAYADVAFGDATGYDILFVPGGAGTRREVENPALLDWIARMSAQAEYTLSVCTGSALLARAGVLDGRRATSNKAAFDWVRSQGPQPDWVAQARWVEDGPVFTSSGVSAGMDMTLAAIKAMLDEDAARKVARWCEYTWHEDRDHDPFARHYGLV